MIKSRYTDEVIFDGTIEEAIKRRIRLIGANLVGMDLSGMDLSGVDLSDSKLIRTDLSETELTGADLSEANLTGADLYGANLTDIIVNWQSRELIVELLRREMGNDIEKRKVVGLIAISMDWCWGRLIRIDDPLRTWCLDVLRKYVRDGDNAPKELIRGYDIS